jgi:hypothetical protein
VDKPQNVVGYDNESDSLVVQPSKQSKVKSIQNIEAWTDGFINYIKKIGPIAYLYLLVSSIQRGSICNYCEP